MQRIGRPAASHHHFSILVNSPKAANSAKSITTIDKEDTQRNRLVKVLMKLGIAFVGYVFVL